ncbi:hypothetical protein [Spirochaeta isovalerica]|uniref:Uncharacterized protein n=1 Tax=Spirochaeta isovalerica TaxID=150 RepID=A0A841RA82_9SPIO|nr:hypothetical protein [Spirochaeta isovalerica]MBB6482284.1 hypothetical protein [Spirochaeta isovalerica]
MDYILGTIIGWGIILLLLTPLFLHRGKKARKLINEWAIADNYELLDVKYKYFGSDIFSFIMKGYKMSYLVKVIDIQNEKKQLWLEIGDYWTGLLFSDINDIKTFST